MPTERTQKVRRFNSARSGRGGGTLLIGGRKIERLLVRRRWPWSTSGMHDSMCVDGYRGDMGKDGFQHTQDESIMERRCEG